MALAVELRHCIQAAWKLEEVACTVALEGGIHFHTGVVTLPVRRGDVGIIVANAVAHSA
ncbi:hypothetical protein D3C76_1798220 [compost metagenome]